MTDASFALLLRELVNLTDKQLEQLLDDAESLLQARIFEAMNEGQYDKHCC